MFTKLIMQNSTKYLKSIHNTNYLDYNWVTTLFEDKHELSATLFERLGADRT